MSRTRPTPNALLTQLRLMTVLLDLNVQLAERRAALPWLRGPYSSPWKGPWGVKPTLRRARPSRDDTRTP